MIVTYVASLLKGTVPPVFKPYILKQAWSREISCKSLIRYHIQRISVYIPIRDSCAFFGYTERFVSKEITL